MAVAAELSSWSGRELGSPVKKKRSWGADAQQLVQLMMGQLRSQPSAAVAAAVKPELTLDLLGNGDPSSSCVTGQLFGSSDLDLHVLRREQPLPSGWEKCLDLQTGKLYFVNQATGVSSFDDPRKRLPSQGEVDLQTAQTRPLAHEFLCSKRSETLRQETALKAAPCISSSGSPHPTDFHLFSTGKQLWNLQLDDRQGSGAGSSSRMAPLEEDSNLELDLNLVAGGATSSPTRRAPEQTVCTMEMIRNALKRTESTSKSTFKRHKKHSISSSFSSLTNSTRSELSRVSPSTSSSSSASSTSSLPGASHRPSSKACTGVESIKMEPVAEPTAEPARCLVMGACTRCLMYVMLNKSNPMCPRCETHVPVDFSTSTALPRKKLRGGNNRR